jgi:hypothetical protein
MALLRVRTTGKYSFAFVSNVMDVPGKNGMKGFNLVKNKPTAINLLLDKLFRKHCSYVY